MVGSPSIGLFTWTRTRSCRHTLLIRRPDREPQRRRVAMLCHDPMGQRGVPHHINAGVFVANLRHPLIGPLACTWRRRLWWEAWRYRVRHNFTAAAPANHPSLISRTSASCTISAGIRPAIPRTLPGRAEDLCTFNTMSGTLVRHVFGGPGVEARMARMRSTLNSSRAFLQMRAREKRGRRARALNKQLHGEEDANSCCDDERPAACPQISSAASTHDTERAQAG